MSKKRAPQTELNHNTRLFIDPANMVVLRAANGEAFLVEKNCAMVSRRFREMLVDVEGTLSAALQLQDAGSSLDFPSQQQQSNPASSLKERTVDMNRTIPYYDMEWERRPAMSNSGKAMFTVAEILDHRQKHSVERAAPMDMPATTGKNSGRAPVTPAGPRRPALSCIEDDNGVRRYPLFDFPDVKADLLEAAIRFMYLKYRLDSEPEKRQVFTTNLLGEGSAVRLIAASAILGIADVYIYIYIYINHTSITYTPAATSDLDSGSFPASLLSGSSQIQLVLQLHRHTYTNACLLAWHMSMAGTADPPEARETPSNTEPVVVFMTSGSNSAAPSSHGFSSEDSRSSSASSAPVLTEAEAEADGEGGGGLLNGVAVGYQPSPATSGSDVPLAEETHGMININSTKRRGACCICGFDAQYTCPACGKGTCCVTCVRTHKAGGCTGLPDPAVKVALRDFTDRQLQRDFFFLEDCRRALNNMERVAPPDASHASTVGSSSIRQARALQEAARSRGIWCDIQSAGMRRRERNTSAVCPDGAIRWLCELRFRSGEQVDFTLCPSWPREEHTLGDVIRHAARDAAPGLEGPAALTEGERDRQGQLDAFLSRHDGDVAVLFQAQRLGSKRCFFKLSTSATLGEALREVCTVTEFPSFEVVGRRDLEAYPLASDVDREAAKAVWAQLLQDAECEKASRGKRRRRPRQPSEAGAERHVKGWGKGAEACHAQYFHLPICLHSYWFSSFSSFFLSLTLSSLLFLVLWHTLTRLNCLTDAANHSPAHSFPWIAALRFSAVLDVVFYRMTRFASYVFSVLMEESKPEPHESDGVGGRDETVSTTSTSDEPEVAVVDDGRSYFIRRCPKSKDAIWVRGLSREDEEAAIEQLRQDEMRRQEALLPQFMVMQLGKKWLWYPNIAGLLFVIAMILSPRGAGTIEELRIASTYETVRPLIQRRGESLVGCFSRTAPVLLCPASLTAALYAATLAITVAVSTHHFPALCSVGAAGLYVVGLISQYCLLFQGFRSLGPKPSDTDLEMVLCIFYAATVVKAAGPLVALALVQRTVGLTTRSSYTAVMKGLMLLPPVTLLGMLASSHLGLGLPVNQDVLYGVTLVSWGVFWWRCTRQKDYELPIVIPPEPAAVPQIGTLPPPRGARNLTTTTRTTRNDVPISSASGAAHLSKTAVHSLPHLLSSLPLLAVIPFNTRATKLPPMFLPPVVQQQSLRILECAPCAVDGWRRAQRRPWEEATAGASLDMAATALAVAGASQILLPASLVHYLEAEGLSPVLRGTWDTLKDCGRSVAVLLDSPTGLRDWLRLNRRGGGPVFRKVVVPVPGGPLCARVLFPELLSCAAAAPALRASFCPADQDVEWVAWMRSALSCRFEGGFPAAIRVGDLTAELLSEGGHGRPCSSVIWEEGIAGATSPRWVETMLKSASACGVPLHQLGASLCERSHTGATCWLKCVEAGLSLFATSSLPHPMFELTDNRMTLPRVQQLIEGYNDVASTTSNHHDAAADCTASERSRQWSLAMQATWDTLCAIK
eukprot:gene8643-6072_t